MIDFKPIDRRRAEDMFAALPQEAKWAEVTGALLGGQAVFVPHMSRNQLEVLRGDRQLPGIRSGAFAVRRRGRRARQVAAHGPFR